MTKRYLIVRERAGRNTEDGTYRTTYEVAGRYYTLEAAMAEIAHQQAKGNYWVAKPKADPNAANMADTFKAEFFHAHFDFLSACYPVRREPDCLAPGCCTRCPIRNGCAEWIG